MRKKILYLSALLLLVINVPYVLSQANQSAKKTPAKSNTSIPEDLLQVFKKSCMDCHGNGGNRMAMMKVNFSIWDNNKPEKKASKAANICKVVTKGSMPTKSYIKSHPDAALSQEQKDKICKWSESLAKK